MFRLLLLFYLISSSSSSATFTHEVCNSNNSCVASKAGTGRAEFFLSTGVGKGKGKGKGERKEEKSTKRITYII